MTSAAPVCVRGSCGNAMPSWCITMTSIGTKSAAGLDDQLVCFAMVGIIEAHCLSLTPGEGLSQHWRFIC